jgi:hypothetical protein
MRIIRYTKPFAIALALNLATSAGAEDFFTAKIEPIFKQRCYECHSHLKNKMKGGLTLDSKSGWEKGGDSGPAIIPGDPEESLLIELIRWGDKTHQMPPDKKLPAPEIALFEEWVKRGAPDPRLPTSADKSSDWWSLRPLPSSESYRSEVLKFSKSGPSPIDLLVQKKLHENGLKPSPEADRRTLIRRLTFDLHGLPPTIENVTKFVNDQSSNAYEKLVDQLLASPRYGERWARHWLDTIHFADTHGFEHDVFRPNAWRYRDYVISALNQDIPWSQFIREQIAADAFYPDKPELKAALGFLGAGPYDQSTASTAQRTYDYLDRDDMVNQTMSAFTSTTASCARCHNHKFDPISQEDYYSLQAVFAGISKGDLNYDASNEIARSRKHWQDLIGSAENLDSSVLMRPENKKVVADWEKSNGKTIADWQVATLDTFYSADGATLTREPDGSILASGKRPDRDTYTASADPGLKPVTALRLEVLRDEKLPKNGPGRQDNGNLHLSEFEAYYFKLGTGSGQKLKFKKVSADFNQDSWTINHAVDGNERTAWGIFPKINESHLAVFQLTEPIKPEPGSRLLIVLKQLHGDGHLVGRFRLSLTDSESANTEAISPVVTSGLKLAENQRTPEQRLAISGFVMRNHAMAELAKLPAQSTVYGVISGPNKPVHILARGDIEKPGKIAEPGSLLAVSNLNGRFKIKNSGVESERRAALANWLSDRENPLTWRSIANRLWHYHFGKGLSDTPSDFGRMGGQPSHPELMDWLASELRDNQGSLKHMHRLIVLSHAYRQSSANRADGIAKDPENRLVWRMNRLRLDAESYRDAVLAVSGRLDLKAGGPGVEYFKTSPGQQLTPKVDYSGFDWNRPEAGRRSIYRVVWRGIPDPFLEALDFPDAALLQPTRTFSASPLQSLALYNNDFMLSQSEFFAKRLEKLGSENSDQVQAAVKLAFLRKPDPAELKSFTAYADKHGLAALCRILFNSNEFMFIP